MSRATTVLAGTTLLGVITSAWLYLDNRDLRDHLAARTSPEALAAASPESLPRDPWRDGRRPDIELDAARSGRISAPAAPSLPKAPRESRNDRRARRNAEISAIFGRAEGETDDEYRSRVMPLVTARLSKMRNRTTEMRRLAEEQAGVTAEQSAALDKTFEKAYSEVLDYANDAITDGRLSPYKRDTANWLELAGGLGTMLNGVNGQISKILDPAQLKAMYDSGFEWGEYLGANAPWERLTPPPPPSAPQ